MDLPFIGSGTDPEKELKELKRELESEMDILEKKADRAFDKQQQKMVEATGKSKHKKKILAQKAKQHTMEAKEYLRELNLTRKRWQVVNRVLVHYKRQNIRSEGTLDAVQEILDVDGMTEMRAKLEEFSKEEMMDDRVLHDISQEIEDMEEIMGPDLEDDEFMETIETLEEVPDPEEKVEEISEEEISLEGELDDIDEV